LAIRGVGGRSTGITQHDSRCCFRTVPCRTATASPRSHVDLHGSTTRFGFPCRQVASHALTPTPTPAGDGEDARRSRLELCRRLTIYLPAQDDSSCYQRAFVHTHAATIEARASNCELITCRPITALPNRRTLDSGYVATVHGHGHICCEHRHRFRAAAAAGRVLALRPC
jgi:hypothetical protein